MKSIEVFNKVAQKIVDPLILGQLVAESGATVYAISDKQYNWLVLEVCKDFKMWDCTIPISFTDNQFIYSINPKNKRNNVPHYIPNNKQYGATHYITKNVIK